MYPWVAVRYLYLPHGVMNVVRCWSSLFSGTLWYPFHASNTVLSVAGGTDRAWWKGDCVWWVSLIACWLRGCMSTVRRGFPFFFAHTTMRWHHVTGSPTGTGSSTPSLTSRSSPALTSSCQWIGTGIGV